MAIGKQVGKRIKELREARGLTQAQLAALLGKSVETISNFERGKVMTSLLTLEQLAGCFRVAVPEFFADSPAAPPSEAQSNSAIKVRNAVDLLSEDDLEIIAGLVDVLEVRRRRRTEE